MNKRILSLLLAIVMVLGVCAAGFTAFAVEDGYIDNHDNLTHTTPKGTTENHSYDEGMCTKCGYVHTPHADVKKNYVDENGNIITDGMCDTCGFCMTHRWNRYGHESATCISDGFDVSICLNCGVRTKTATADKALGHNWPREIGSKYITFEWDENDFQYCKVTFHCMRSIEINAKCAAEISYIVYAGSGYVGNIVYKDRDASVAPTCNQKGKDVYVAVFTIEDASGYEWGKGFTKVDETCPDWDLYKDSDSTYYRFSAEYEAELTELGHDFSIFKNSVQAECTHPQYDVYQCSRCDATENRSVGEPNEHKFEFVSTVKEADCTTNQIDLYRCKCGAEEEREVETTKLPHTSVKVPEVAPTCEGVGYSAGVRCSVCEEIISGCEEVAALGHVFKNYKDDHNGGCTMDGTETAKCERAGCNATDSRPLEGTAKGHIDINVDYKCDVCNEALDYCKAAGHEFTDSTALAGEKFAVQFGDFCAANDIDIDELKDEAHFFQCSECKTWLPFSHKIEIGYKGENTPYHWIGCSECDYRKDMKLHVDNELNYVDQEGNKTTDGLCDVCKGELEHRFKKTAEKAATCTAQGVATYTCMNCGNPDKGGVYEEVTSAALGHNWGEPTFEWDTVNFSSCTAVFKCTRTGCTEEIRYTVTADSGYEGNKITLDKSKTEDPQCTTKGKYVYVATFTVDDIGNFGWHGDDNTPDGKFTFSNEYTVNIPIVGHDFSVLLETTKPTCTEPQMLKYQCSKCDKTTEVTDIDHPALGHMDSNPIADKSKPASCNDEGYEVRQCPRCEAEYKTVIPSYGGEHVWSEYVKDEDSETCLVYYTMTRSCSRCNKVDKIAEPKPNASHNWSDFVGTEPTCTEDGIKVRTCSKCEEKEEVKTPALGHAEITKVTKEATCYASGTKVVTCSRCDYKETKIIPTLGHTYDYNKPVYVAGSEPTCTMSGKATYTCTVKGCGHVSDVRDVKALGHDFSKIDKDGNGNTWLKCSRCGETTVPACGGKHSGKDFDTKYDIDFDRVCDVCGGSIDFMSNALHYIVGVPQFWLRVVFRLISGGKIENMFITRGK